MLSLPTKQREVKLNAYNLSFRKRFNLPSRTLLSAECSFTEYSSSESLTNK